MSKGMFIFKLGRHVYVDVIQTEPQFKTQLSLVELCVTTALWMGEFASVPRPPHSPLNLIPLHRSLIFNTAVLLNNLKKKSMSVLET